MCILKRVLHMLGHEIIPGHFKVTFIVHASGNKVTKSFDSEYHMRKFINKLRHSKKCSLVSFSY